ncbi:MAG: hypothetical protein ACXWUG_13975 [Polyangiales bacterium]
MRIELDEASGPVSPRFQYSLSIVIEDAVVVRSKKGPLGTRDTTLGIDDAKLAALEATLPALEDLVDEERAKRVGVRVNVLRVDDRAIRYLGSDLLGDPTPAQAALRTAREAIFALAR